MSAYPKVAIIGRPNVGKSTLFNRLIGMRHSIIDKAKGVTRDRLYYDMDWSGNYITLIDTGGIVTANDQEELLKNVRKQSLRAINESDLIVFLVDAKEGIHPLDQEIADILRRGSKRTILAVNKVDNEKAEPEIHEFSSLGFGYIAAVSALHGRGIGNLLDIIINNTAKVSTLKSDSGIIKIAIIGRPNAGKSSFLNKLIKDDRVLVDSVPGTTRDSVDTYFTFGDTNFMLIDTAGIRHRGKVKAGVDYFSSIRTEQSINRADIILFMVDGYEGLRRDDLHFIYKIWEAKKALIIAINKKDLIEKPLGDYEKLVKERLIISEYIPVVYMSAKTGKGVEDAISAAKSVYSNLGMRITTSRLNSFIEEIKNSYPKMIKGRKMFKIYYATQAEVYPPAIVFTVNCPELLRKSFFNFLERKLREKFGFLGAPIRLIFNGRDE